jgi:hypothetical protein
MNTKIAKRHDRNPFVENMMVPVGKRQVTLSKLGKDDNVLINQHTGEIHGTHVTTYKRVDSEQFIKLFTANVALTFDLNAAGIKAFNVLLWTMQSKTIDSDLVPLDKFTLEEFVEAHPDLSLSQATFLRGLAVLEKAQIVAKHLRQGWYYINPNFVFNGDRIAFTQVIERTKRGERDEKTLDIFGDE